MRAEKNMGTTREAQAIQRRLIRAGYSCTRTANLIRTNAPKFIVDKVVATLRIARKEA